jgi:hypothetical protein
MRKLILALLLLQTPLLLAAKPKPDPADYNLTVHVIGSYSRQLQRIDAVIDGHSMELTCTDTGAVLALGDYKARIVPHPLASKVHNGHDLFLAYEFLFSDGSVREYRVTGLNSSESSAPSATTP